MLKRVFPFLEWFRSYDLGNLRADVIAGLTVALVLIPQSMAYAQLAGLPAYYGLYASFLPPIAASLFGSSRQLATGPVAVVSLMTAAALEPFATRGSDAFVAYAILMALVVGLLQLALGILRLGLVVNFLSHPVVNGFTNGAAIIIATSQLSKIFGVYVDEAEHHYETIYRVVKAALAYTHWPSFALAVLAFALMYGIKRFNPRIPYVLVAVIVTAFIAWMTGFEHDVKVGISAIQSEGVKAKIREFNRTIAEIDEVGAERAALGARIMDVEEKGGSHSLELLELRHRSDEITLRLEDLKEGNYFQRDYLRSLHFVGTAGADGDLLLCLAGEAPADAAVDGKYYRIRAANRTIDESKITFIGGGSLVGVVPKGIPLPKVPAIDMRVMLQLLPVAAVISLLGFMEAISIAKAMAAKTGQRLDPNQELIGQGLANIMGAATQGYPVSGSFSRSAVNLQAGAVTGMSSVFTGGIVLITLLFLTPTLYYIPQSVLAAIIMMAVVSLLNVRGFVHAWHAQKYDGLFAVISFVATLVFAPHLDKGIMFGVALSLGHYLYRNMKPGVASLSMHPDCSLRDAERWNLRQCKYMAVIRFDGPLFFANTSYLEDRITERIKAMPELRHVLIVAHGINELDASGEEMLSLLVDRLRAAGYELSFSGLKDTVVDVLKRTHLYEKIGGEHMYPTQAIALDAIHARAHVDSDEEECPLVTVCPIERFRAMEMARTMEARR
ncbi:MAG: SulP family inorganic anion transporter [Acidobacteriota bacterium]